MAKLPTMEEMTSLYLYGQTIPPKNKVHQSLVSRQSTLPYPVSAQDFMNGPGVLQERRILNMSINFLMKTIINLLTD